MRSSSSEIDLDHAFVGGDLVERAFGQHRAFVQHRDAHAEPADKVHIVLDHDDGMVPGDLAQQVGGGLGLAVGHAGNGFVDQKQLGVLGDQHADLQPLLLAVAERASGAIAVGVEADGAEDLVDAGGVRRVALPEQVVGNASVAGERQQQVILDRVHLEYSGFLEFSADAEVGDRRLVELGEVHRAVEHHLAVVGPGLAGDDVHHGRLAGRRWAR